MADPLAPLVERTLRQRRTLLSVETPAYVLDAQLLRERARHFRRAFQGCRACYAFKANDLPALVTILKEEGFDADVASSLELRLAIRLGFKRIIYTSPVKSDADLKLAAGCAIINADSMAELRRLVALGVRARVSLRVRLGPWTKFGLAEEEVPRAIRFILRHDLLKLVGLHAHASWGKPSDYAARLRTLVRLAPPGLEFLDAGGGFLPEGSSRYAEGRVVHDRPAPIERFAEALLSVPRSAELWVEPGRWLVAPCTMILGRVSGVRRDAVVLDAGMHMVGQLELEDPAAPVVNLSRPGRRRRELVYGPLCDPGEVWSEAYYGGRGRVGDAFAILHQGAYAFSNAWRWQQPVPHYLVMDGREVSVAKRAETFADRYAGCKL